ncbi:MAG TPA: transposase [Nitrososphaerales archaeon]|nr:transposase [Nitrososphaerales archaeon]
MLRSYKKNHDGELRIPEVKRLATRIDGELFKIIGDQLRVTLQPGNYAWLAINKRDKHYEAYSTGRPSELLLTDRNACLTFTVSEDEYKPLGRRLLASDLNFRSVDMTVATRTKARLTDVRSESLGMIVQIQNDFSRRRMMLQRHIKNPQKRQKKLSEMKGRQKNRIKDALHKLSTKMVRENPDTTFVFENLRGIRKAGDGKNRRFRFYLNRWPYRMFQSFVDYKSSDITKYVNPRGTSSECPVCGGKVEHPTWAVSRCRKCGVDYDRNRLASLAILCRGLCLCGQPFAVSADASWHHMRSEYLYTGGAPDNAARAGWTDAASASNGDVGYENTRS